MLTRHLGTRLRWIIAWAALALLGSPAVGQSPPHSLPNPSLTPGAVLQVTLRDICTPGYTAKVRNVPAPLKRNVYAAYGIREHAPGEYEVDHLIPLQLGGSNSMRNLWPQSYLVQPWNAHVKDRLESKLHRLVCSGALDLATAQREIASDWIAAYKKYFRTNVPLSSKRSQSHTGHRSLRRAHG